MRNLHTVMLGLLVMSYGCAARSTRDPSDPRRPNVILILTDDQGYGDLSCYGHPTIHTPHIDALAANGMKFTQFYVPSPVCSPTRTGLLTGCYPKRVGMHRHVIFPQYDYGLNPAEETIADLLQASGYATGCFGKWHLGHRRGLLPTDQGFDEFYGVPYSNDMSQFHRKPGNKYKYRLPLMENERVIEWEPDQHLLSKSCTDRAVDFIERNDDRPFFIYMPFSMPHIPIYASPGREGTSPNGLYGDVIEEIDDCVGRIVERLERKRILDDTLIIFMSDNGPWLPFKSHGGNAGPLRGGKGSNFEGGQRVPCVVQWTGKIQRGRVGRQVTTAMDWLPTIVDVTGAKLPKRKIDGVVLTKWLRRGAMPFANREFLYYESKGDLAAIRRGPWKLFLDSGELYNVEVDIGEKWNQAKKQPELAQELRELALKRDDAIEGSARPTLKVKERVFDPEVGGGTR